ncbi:hypothetical protein SAMD00019534_021470, partial [Acytostelium subglobosum LB1]|uniref:hypothetical protein n=1 Tax=Acytostelium subglobosum LB1 TaxID=1410327 RepID=UPI000644AA87
IMNPFELIPVINNVPCKIESIDIWGSNIYIGTNDGQILMYIIEKVENTGKISFKSRMEKKRTLGHGKKPVEKILLIADIGKLLTLCDGNLDVFNLYNLEPTTPIGPAGKGVTTFCIKKNSPDYRLCVVSKRKISLFEYVRVFDLHKEVILQDTPLAAEWCGNTICLGYRKEYAVLDINKESHRILFTLDRTMPRPKFIMDSHGTPLFLLSTDDLGVLVDMNGEPVQGSVQWSSSPSLLSFWTPYLISQVNGTNSSKVLEIHDIISYRLVQSVTRHLHASPPMVYTAVAEGRSDGGDLLMLASSSPHCVYCLNLNSMDQLIQAMISKGEYEEAVRTFEIFFKKEQTLSQQQDANYDPAMERATHQARLAKIYEQAGLNELHHFKFSTAFKYFAQSRLDARALVALFPSLLPYQTNFRSPLTENLAEMIASSHNTPVRQIEMMDEAKLQLLECLENRFPHIKAIEEQKDIASVQVKLYAEFKQHKKLESVLSRPGIALYQQDLEEWLTNERLYCALGLVYQYTEKYRKALVLWAKLDSGEMTDRHESTGLKESIDLLSATNGIEPPKELVWEFSVYLLKTLSRHLQTFSNNNNNNSRLNHNNTKERQRLLTLLEFSNCYNVPTLLAQIRNSLLYEELVILYLRSGKYDMMFDIIVWKLNDFKKAELICSTFDPHHSLSVAAVTSATASPMLAKSPSTSLDISSISPALRGVKPSVQHSPHLSSLDPESPANASPSRNNKETLYEPKRMELFLCLLKTYLRAYSSNNNNSNTTTTLPTYVIEFLNNYYFEMDPIKVLKLLPSTVPVHTIENYLSQSFTFSISSQRETMIVKNLHKSLHMHTKFEHQTVCSNSVAISGDSRCPVCSKPIGDRVFAYFPNGIIVHFKCFQSSYICPVTAHNFKTDPAIKPVSV